MSPAILWFRRNLRLRDNPALLNAASGDRPIIAVYVLTPSDRGGASRWWLHHSLAALAADVEAGGGRLLLREGDAADQLAGIAAATGAGSIHFQHRYEPAALAEEQALTDRLGDSLDICGVHDGLLNHPDTVMTQSDTPYKVFTPFWRAAGKLGEPDAPAAAVPDVTFGKTEVASADLDGFGLLPTAPDWAGGLRAAWSPGEDGALEQLDGVPGRAARYADDRDRPDRDATSRLSPHLHFGEVSVRQVWSTIRAAEGDSMPASSVEALLRQLYWRDFSYYLLYHFPDLPEKPLRPEFEHFPWIEDDTLLSAWQHGRTGYPIVDAGMRQLWETGWMHNRVRMIVASFLVKDLMIPWQHGAAWFLDTLVDADLANNSAGWQWVAGCGTDAAPYFRIFNPSRQGEKFDPDKAYVRQWVPEYGTDGYPDPIVDHSTARQQALEAYGVMKSAR